MQVLLFVFALAFGVFVTWVDTRPTWDDTGITVVAILVISGVLGFLGPKRPWLWALAVGVGIPVVEILRTRGYASVVALVIAFAGAYGGMAARNALLPVRR